MYYSKDYLEKKTGPHGIGRPNYLKSLVDEFRSCHDQKDSRRQVLANLANFAYDPINYDYMRRLNVIQIFIDTLDAEDEKLIEFAMAGLCNLSLDKDNKLLILNKDAIQKITTCLSNSNVETVLNAISTLMFLVTAESKAAITSPAVVQVMMKFQQSSNKRLSNLATVFLEDYCTDVAKSVCEKDVLSVDLPT